MGELGGVLNTPPRVSADTSTTAPRTTAATANPRRNVLGLPGGGSPCFRAGSSSGFKCG